jgi:tetratricopeptide (TPR) repeat protein
MAQDMANTPAKQMLRQAGEHLNAGRAQQAEGLIRQILQTQPDNAEALNLLGVIALNSGHTPQAVEIFSRAVQLHESEAEYLCNLGVALLSANRTPEGEAALHAALKLKPSHPMANFNLGLRDLQAGRFEDALQRLDKAVQKMPQNVALLNALGVAYSKCAKAAKAVQVFRAALKLQPNHADAMLNLASALTEMDKPDEAMTLLERTIQARPREARLYFNLGVAARKAKRDLDAIAAYRQALALEPNYADAHVNLAVLHSRRGNQDAALEHIRAARTLRPDDICILTNEARIVRDAGHGTEAISLCDRILAQTPDHGEASSIKISVLQNEGDFDEAQKIGEQALAINPDATPVLLALTHNKNYPFTDEQIQRLKSAATRKTEDDAEAIRSWFALGKIHHDRGEYEQAFDCYKRGNALRDVSLKWTPSDEQSLFTALIDTFSADFFTVTSAKEPAMGQDSERPVFIVGMPRSGTTLVEQIIASHPHGAGGGELPDISIMADELPRTLNSAAPYPPCVNELSAAQVETLAARYLARLTRISATDDRVTDKMPDNYLHLGLIALLFPKARVIHCRRNPMANCFSIFQQNFAGYHPYAYDLTKLGRRYRNHGRLMDHWRQVLPLPILEVDYEDIVADQEGQSRRILEFCGLEWNDAVLDFHKTQRTVQTASLWQVRQPIYTGALKGWCAYEKFLGPLKKSLEQD